MQKKHNALFLILGIMALVITAYSLFITVFNQIISQNEGFFYAIVFGGILILVYVFINIVVKLLNISNSARGGRALDLSCIFIMVLMCGIYLIWRISYRSTVDINETTIYHIATLISNDSVSVSRDTTDFLLNHPSYFFISSLYSLLFELIPDFVNFSVVINGILSCLSAVLCFFTARKLTDGICGILAVFSILFLPGNMFLIYSDTPECLTAVFFFGFLLSLTYLIDADENYKKIICVIFYSILSAMLCLNEPVFLIVVILMPICLLGTHRKNAYLVLLSAVIGVILSALMILFKALIMDITFLEVLSSFFKCFVPFKDVDTGAVKPFADLKGTFDNNVGAIQTHIENNFNFIVGRNNATVSQLGAAWLILLNQLMYMFFLILTLSSIFSIIQNKDKRMTPEILLLVLSTISLFFQANRSVDTFYYHGLVALISSVGYFYMYLNHHPEDKFVFSKIYNLNIYEEEMEKERLAREAEPSEEEMELRRQEFLLRANALIFKDENIALYNMIKAEEKANVKERPLEASLNLEEEILKTTEDDIYEDNVYSGDDLDSSDGMNPTEDVAPAVEADIVSALPKDVPQTIEMPKISEDVLSDSKKNKAVNAGKFIDKASGKKTFGKKESEKTPEITEDNDTPVSYIPNPLPVPVRRPHTSLDYDFDIDDSGSDWDFDFKDIHLKDFDV